MPLLTITSTRQVASDRKAPFFEEVAELYADVMHSETRFLSLQFNKVPREDLWLGRADPESDIVVLEADIREGRPTDQRRAFALEFMEKIHEAWEIPYQNMKVVFTEHEGTHMMGYDRIGGEWDSPDGG